MKESCRVKNLLLGCLLVVIAGCGDEAPATGQPAREIDWSALMPADYDPVAVLPDMDISGLDDADPQAERYMAMLRDLWDNAPVVAALDGERIRLPGYVVPLTFDERTLQSFLLVPYYGACIHVPPPPSNQVVHVSGGADDLDPQQLWDPVWVTGVLRTEHVSSEVGEAGYRMEAISVEPYEFDDTPPADG